MLPEALSNGWCSLRPDEDRGCLFVEMHVDATGQKTRHRFGRGLMRSAARLTYEQVQQAHEAHELNPFNLHVGEAVVPTLPSLYAAFRLLLQARAGTRHARSRPARAPRGAGRRRQGCLGGAAAASRQPPADRGVHGAGQCLRRRGTGTAAPALRVSGARAAVGRKARKPAVVPAPVRHLPAAGHAAAPPRSRPRAARRRRHRACAAGERGDAAQPDRRPPTRSTTSAISAWRCRAMPISPARSAATPTCWCIAR